MVIIGDPFNENPAEAVHRHGGPVGTEAAGGDGPELRDAGRDSRQPAAGCLAGGIRMRLTDTWFCYSHMVLFQKYGGVFFSVQQ